MATQAIACPADDAAWRTRNLGALLFAATDRAVREKLRVVHAGGFGALTDAQLALFTHLDRDGTRLTTIATRAGLTKQNMIELIDRASALGLVGRHADPADGRARIVRPTATGLALLTTLEHGIAVAEAHVAHQVGTDFLAEVKHRLVAYAAPTIEAAAVTAGAAWRARSIGRLMAMSARRFAAEALAAARQRGGRDVGEALLALLRNLDLEGTRLTIIAERARMTKQSMRELVDRAEALGFVARAPDPGDRRAKTIRFTPAGLALLDDLRDGLEQAEERFAAETSAIFTERLRHALSRYAAG